MSKEFFRLPAPVDPHVHLREPGATQKEDFETGTMAAVAGGYTTVLDMPNNPGEPTTSPEALQEKINLAKDRVYCDIGFYFGAILDSVRHFEQIENQVFGFKTYMEETTGDLLVTEQRDLESIFSNRSGKLPIPVHASGKTLQNAIDLAKKYNKWLHACHVATEEGILKIKKAKEDGIRVTCEVTPHHLFLTEDDLPRLGPFGMMKPPLATKRDQQALWDNLDIIDALATDHAPYTRNEKLNSIKPPYGVTGLETAIPLMLTAVKEGRLSMKKLIELIYINPRKIFNISETPDTYTEVDLDDSYVIDNKNLYTKAKWTPFDGAKVTGRIRKVVLRGNIIFDGENIMQPALGKVIYPK